MDKTPPLPLTTCPSNSPWWLYCWDTQGDGRVDRHVTQMSERAFGRRMLRELSSMQGGSKLDFWELLWHFSKSISTDERDRVYNLLKLLSDMNSDECTINFIDVGYNKPTSDVFWDAVFECKAPCNEYYRVLDSLYSNPRLFRINGVNVEKSLRIRTALKDYCVRDLTSSRHLACDRSAIDVLEPIDLVVEIFRSTVNKSCCINELWSFSKIGEARHKMSYLQDACAVGLMLSQCAQSDPKSSKRILWNCAVKRMAQCKSNSTYEGKKLQYKDIDEVRVAQSLFSLCSCCESLADSTERTSDFTGLALDIVYEDIEVDFGMSIYS